MNLLPDVSRIQRDVDDKFSAVQTQLAAIRGLLERLVELEEQQR